MYENPILSICIPAFNRPEWFRRSLISITQCNSNSRRKFETVIADDSDTRNCEKISEAVLTNLSWRYEHHPISLGMAENWNRTMSLSKGEYIVILHDDDFFIRRGLDQLLHKLENPEIQKYSVLLFGSVVVDEQERILKRQIFSSDLYLTSRQALTKLFSDSSFVRFPALVVKRSAIKAVGDFRPVWREPCDVEMWLRLFKQYGVYCCRETTVAYRVHSQALTMGAFNPETISLLLGLFGELESTNILNSMEIKRCKNLFFHQFILAGSWRQLRRKKWRKFLKVMNLFETLKKENLRCPMRWLVIKWCFEIFKAADVKKSCSK